MNWELLASAFLITTGGVLTLFVLLFFIWQVWESLEVFDRETKLGCLLIFLIFWGLVFAVYFYLVNGG